MAVVRLFGGFLVRRGVGPSDAGYYSHLHTSLYSALQPSIQPSIYPTFVSITPFRIKSLRSIMVKEDDKSAKLDKGKGKAVDTPDKKDVDPSKPTTEKSSNGAKKGKKDEPQEGMFVAGKAWLKFDEADDYVEELSEEDQQLKSELEMLVERLKVICYFYRAPGIAYLIFWI